MPQFILNKRIMIVMLVVLGAALVLSGCSALPGGGKGEVNPLPTPLPAEDVGEEAGSAAGETPQETWERYRDDIVAEQVRQRESLITLRERYERPETTEANLESIVTDIDLVEGGDRTEWNISGDSASSFVEFDVRLTYANGDNETKTCRFNVALEFDEEDGVWYVVNPSPLQVFADCQ